MTRLLYIDVSPRRRRSHSARAGDAFLAAYAAAHPEHLIERLNLWQLELPRYDGAFIDARYSTLAGAEMPPEQQQAWAHTRELAEQLRSADKLVIATPMWNFGVPYRLKQYIDIVTQPGMLWRWDPASGYQGLAGDRPTLLIQSAAGRYDAEPGAHHPLDHLSAQLATWLDFIGIRNRRTLWVAPTFADADALAQLDAHSAETAQGLARRF